MLVEITLTDEELAELRELTGIEDPSAALRFAVLEYLRAARQSQPPLHLTDSAD